MGLVVGFMRFISTRSGMAPAGFTDVLLSGLAPDGGLVVPENTPTIGQERLEGWRPLSYPELGESLRPTP